MQLFLHLQREQNKPQIQRLQYVKQWYFQEVQILYWTKKLNNVRFGFKTFEVEHHYM